MGRYLNGRDEGTAGVGDEWICADWMLAVMTPLLPIAISNKKVGPTPSCVYSHYDVAFRELIKIPTSKIVELFKSVELVKLIPLVFVQTKTFVARSSAEARYSRSFSSLFLPVPLKTSVSQQSQVELARLRAAGIVSKLPRTPL